jgi:alanyl aminopeptidase
MNSITKAFSGILIFAVLLAGCSQPDDGPDATAAESVPVARLGTTVVPERYRLELRIDPREERFSGSTSIDLKMNAAVDSIWLHGKDLAVSAVHLVDGNGERIAATYEERDDTGVALVSLASTAPAGKASLHVEYSAPFNTATNGLYRVERGDEAYAATQFQPISARRAFPGFDEPAFKVPFDLSLVTRAGDTAITTTPEADVEDLDGGLVRHTFETTRPLPTYLLAFAVGPYDVVDYGAIPPNKIRDREVRLRGIVAKGLADRVDYALQHTDGLLTTLEEYFGTPYPYEKLDLIAVPASFGGAMENVGAIVYDEYLLLMDEESPLDQRRAYTAGHAHEIAHMWFGNLVTPEWWNDIWLNESFASWMMYKAADTYWPDGEFDRQTLKDAIGAMSSDALAAARRIREPVEHSNEIASAFDGITYDKGGGVLAMLERYVGEDAFRDGIRLHMDRFADRTATAEDFIASVAEGSDRAEIEAAFRSFVEQPGVPLLTVRLDCNSGDTPRLQVSQSRYAALGSSIEPTAGVWQIPMCVSYEADGGVASSCAFVADNSSSIGLETDACPAWVHPNADGAGYYRFALDDAGWQALIDNAASLSASEALVFLDSLDAALRAGRVSSVTYLDGLAGLLRHDAWDVVESVADSLEKLSDIVEAENMGTVYAAMRRMVRPVFDALDDDGSSGDTLLRERLLRFLIVVARDAELRAPLAQQAVDRIGLDGEPDPDAAPAGELETIFSVGVQDIGEPFFNRLLEEAKASVDPAFREAAIGALARVEDPALVTKLQSAVLEGSFKGTEALGIVRRQMARAATTEQTFQWLQANGETIVNMIPQTFRARILPMFGSWFCTQQKADEWQAFVESHDAAVPGYERALAQATESVMLCASLRENSQDELLDALSIFSD